jgi:hypothetical protein
MVLVMIQTLLWEQPLIQVHPQTLNPKTLNPKP